MKLSKMLVTASLVLALAIPLSMDAMAQVTTLNLASGPNLCTAVTDASGLVNNVNGSKSAKGVTFSGNCTTGNVIVPPPVPGRCVDPAGLTRQTSGQVFYVMSGRANRDLTSWNDIWGHMTSTDTAVAWPGRSSSPPIIEMGRNNYIAAQFVVPVGVSQSILGIISRTTYNYGIDMEAAISTQCGDFSPPNLASCTSHVSGVSFPTFQTRAGGTKCYLAPGTYYLNIKAVDPRQVTATCPANSNICPVGTQLNFNP